MRKHNSLPVVFEFFIFLNARKISFTCEADTTGLSFTDDYMA